MQLSTIKFWIVLILIFTAIQGNGQGRQNQPLQTAESAGNNQNMEARKTLHDFTVKDIDGNDFSLASLKGKKVLVVNVASKCGLTPQYEQLQELYEKYRHLNFVVIGFPANNFMGQEPGSNLEIKEFCTANYGVTFPMMEKISVKGKDQAPLYKWLTKKSENGVMDQKVTWNFQKFMIDEEGHLVDVVMPKESPMSDKILNWITGS
ncbi:glutathione peroxidase [Porphyromonadaceae bacterium KH3CP3RA]|nr:glutathione peroxidase [Porphyromonadaceae bacterium KH3CP3RA]